MKGKGLLVLVILASSAASAFFFHKEARILFLTTYHIKIKKTTPSTAEKKAEGLYRDNKYAEAAAFSADSLALYPGNRKLLRIAGLSHMKLDDRLAGAKFLMPVITGSEEDRQLLGKIAAAFFEADYYTDIISLLGKFPPGSDPALAFYLGASLARTGRYAEALPHLEKSEGRGSNNPEVHYLHGLIHEKRGGENAAIEHYREALERNPFHEDARRALIGIYNRKSMYKEAERLMRSRLF